MRSHACKVCKMTGLVYRPPVIPCIVCFKGIRRNGWMYIYNESVYCNACYDHVTKLTKSDGTKATTTDLVKKKNDAVVFEPLTRCSACHEWVHEVCGLIITQGQDAAAAAAAPYLCPQCLLKSGRPPAQAMLGASDLPKTALSDALEERLRAHVQVSDAEPLAVRVVGSTVKTCKAPAGLFGDEPVGFPYHQRILLLFQKLDGADVCLLALDMHEYGADCPAPNRNTVHFSYLDTVPYLRLVQQATRRSSVYRQLIIGYLDYVKGLGFERMLIWSCPPSAATDDYVLHCHPLPTAGGKPYRTPEELLHWYRDILTEAEAEGIVESWTTFWDGCFTAGQCDPKCDPKRKPKCNHKCTPKCDLAAVPYFEGHVWPKLVKEGMEKKKKRGEQLMEWLGKQLEMFRDNHLMVQLCKSAAARPQHDDDAGLDSSDIFHTCQAFQSFCIDRHLQFDSLRRAKHTTLMVLHHLHNPSLSTFVSDTSATCDACAARLQAGCGYQCSDPLCEFDLCDACYDRPPPHEHPLEARASKPRAPLSAAERRRDTFKRALKALEHASSCRKLQCTPQCHKAKGTMAHWTKCGDCQMCRLVWQLISTHSQTCDRKRGGCVVPKCWETRQRRCKQAELAALQTEKRRAAHEEMPPPG